MIKNMSIISVSNYGDNLFNSRVRVSYKELPGFISEQNLDYHYNTLHKNYLIKTPPTNFSIAGLYLHNLFFSQFNEHKTHPNTAVVFFILSHFNSLDEFKDSFRQECNDLKGSGWICLTKEGKIQTIKDHMIVDGILLILDMWENSSNLDFGPDKNKYIEAFWNYINWEVVESRLFTENKSSLGRM